MTNQTLLEAAEYIKEHGWIQGHLSDETGAVCAMGAIDAVTDYWNITFTHEAWSVATMCLQKYAKVLGYSGIAYWNDEPGRTQEEVIDGMIEAAETCDG